MSAADHVLSVEERARGELNYHRDLDDAWRKANRLSATTGDRNGPRLFSMSTTAEIEAWFAWNDRDYVPVTWDSNVEARLALIRTVLP